MKKQIQTLSLLMLLTTILSIGQLHAMSGRLVPKAKTPTSTWSKYQRNNESLQNMRARQSGTRSVPEAVKQQKTVKQQAQQSATLLQRAKQAVINFGTAVYQAPGKAVAYLTNKPTNAKNNVFQSTSQKQATNSIQIVEPSPLTTENLQKHNLNRIKAELANIPSKPTTAQKTQSSTNKSDFLAQRNLQKEINLRNTRDAKEGIEFSETL
ncbi:MAG: hypothetical protein Q8Q60_04315 [Candidatus Chromulinivorax sp.]|nr:hypothetical protein [Candidatus Chromulinivorax sp.]